MITARKGWLRAEVTVGHEDRDLVLDAMNEADILRIDLEEVERIHVARCDDEADLMHFVLAMDRNDLSQIDCEKGDRFAVVSNEHTVVTQAHAELRRTTFGRGQMIDLCCHHLSIKDHATAAALRAALTARAGRFTHGPGFAVWAPPPPAQ